MATPQPSIQGSEMTSTNGPQHPLQHDQTRSADLRIDMTKPATPGGRRSWVQVPRNAFGDS
jgi:hypothetical protein